MKFLKKGIKNNGKYFPCRYSAGKLHSYPDGTISIYAKNYGDLPTELNPQNGTDTLTDCFEGDCVRIIPGSKFYNAVKTAMGI